MHRRDIIRSVAIAVFLAAGLVLWPHLPDAPPVAGSVAQPTKTLGDKHLLAVQVFAATFRQALNDPDSLQWVKVLSNDDGALICASYRAKNGFGSLVLSSVAYAHLKASQDGAFWNRNCAGKQLNDDTIAAEYEPNLR
jgi:hypothetical protein